MNYACAHWANAKEEDFLETAQKRKIHHLLRKAQLNSSHHLLDIGCGWGDLAITAAQTTGCRVTGVTLAEEQKQLAEKRVKEAGLDKNGQVRILLCDYRSTPAPGEGKQYYDRIISVGMFEHVGPQFLDGYFEVISKLLHPVDGRMVIDGITKMNKVLTFLALWMWNQANRTVQREQKQRPLVHRPLRLPRRLPPQHPHAAGSTAPRLRRRPGSDVAAEHRPALRQDTNRVARQLPTELGGHDPARLSRAAPGSVGL